MIDATAASSRLVGRDEDVQRIRALLSDGTGGGGATLLIGDPGTGKTALLDQIATDAGADGVQVLRGSGVQFESDISYSGLHQILFGLHGSFDSLDVGHRDALQTALSFTVGPAPSRMLVSNAVLLLIRKASTDRPLLLVVDDLPWLDRASAAVLSFVARRLVGSEVSFLGASRPQTSGFFQTADLPRYQLGPLDDRAAHEIVSLRSPALAPSVRQRVVTEAAGNPLALLELPEALTTDQRRAAAQLPAVLPLTERLESLFAARVAKIPETCRRILLLGALDHSGGQDAIRAAGAKGLELLAPAEREGLVDVAPDSRRFVFRHPLVRSAVVTASTTSERQQAHHALAGVSIDDPEHLAWYLGEAAAGSDEEVAAALERSAQLARSRGDALGAIVRLDRAAGLSPESPSRARRLALAAYLGAESIGRNSGAERHLEKLRTVWPTPLLEVAASVTLLVNNDGDVLTAHDLLASALETGEHCFDEALADSLFLLLNLSWYSCSAEAWERYFTLYERLGVPTGSDLALVTRLYADPANPDPDVVAEVMSRLTSEYPGGDPSRIIRLATAVQIIDPAGTPMDLVRRVARQARAGAAPPRRLIGALCVIGQDQFETGRWDELAETADEGAQLAAEQEFHHLTWTFRYQRALVAATRGDDPSGAEELVQWAAARRMGIVEKFARRALSLHHVGQGDFPAAYREATAITSAGSLPRFVPQAIDVSLELVEAAVRIGRQAEAEAHAAALRASGVVQVAPRIALISAGAEALVAENDQVRAAFGRALASAGAERWPFLRARIQLAYGERLRRMGALAEARVELLAAAEVFRRLDAVPWMERADNERRATGLSRRRAAIGDPPELTAREREIAELAAAGLTNKEIGERLFLSHRTVGSHLYQLFPKLGLTSRAGLRDALTVTQLRSPSPATTTGLGAVS
jgi:DNA-binding NarL/FixJ family response regulator